MSGSKASIRTKIWVWVILAVVSNALATGASAQAADDPTVAGQRSNLAYRRVFVPAGAPESWPVGKEKYLPIPHDEFQRHVEARQSISESERQPSVHLKNARHELEFLSNNTLKGTSTWQVELLGEEPQLVSIRPLSFATQTAHWRRDSERAARLGLWSLGNGTQGLALLIEQSDELILDWAQSPTAIEAEFVEFLIQMPSAVPQNLQLHLPASYTATVSSAHQISFDTNSHGQSRLNFQLGPQDSHRLRIHRPAISDDRAKQPLISQDTSYELRPSRLSLEAAMRFDGRGTDANELRAELEAGLTVINVTIDGEPVDWRLAQVDERWVVTIARPESEQPQLVVVRCVAKPVLERTWVLPKLRFLGVGWTEGSTSLLVAPELELRSIVPQRATLQHIVGISEKTQSGEVYRLQDWSDDASIVIEAGRPQGSLHVESVTTFDTSRASSQARVVARLSNSGGEIYQVRSALAEGWSIDAVTSVPKNALKQWQVENRGGATQLLLQFNRPISSRSAFTLEITARETTGRQLLPATVQNLNVTTFPEAFAHRQILGFRSEVSTQARLNDRLERSKLRREDLSDGDRLGLSDYVDDLLNEPLNLVLIDTESLNATDLIEFQQESVQYTATFTAEIDTLPKSLRTRYRVDIEVESGSISAIELLSDLPLPEDLQWSLTGHSGLVTMERVQSPTEGNSQVQTAGYLLRLPAVMSKSFNLVAEYAQPASSIENCNLIQLPRAVDWRGQVVLRGPLEGLQVLDRGWTPTVPMHAEAVGSTLPVLGAYRLGPEEQRRRAAMSGLRLLRQSSEKMTSQVVGWLAEYHTLQAASGEAIHTATYWLENLGAPGTQFLLPDGAELQEAWLDDRQIDKKRLNRNGKSIRIPLDESQRWVTLALKYSTTQPTLGGSATLQPSLPECSFPVGLNRWTLWAPERFEIENIRRSSTAARSHWWRRVFGPLTRSRDETAFNAASGADWTQLWSEPATNRKTKTRAEVLAREIGKQLDEKRDQPVGQILNDLADLESTDKRIFVDTSAMLADGIRPDSIALELSAQKVSTRQSAARVLPLSSYKLALVAGRDTIILTTMRRVAHWIDQLRPSEEPGVFVVVGDYLTDQIDDLHTAHSIELVDSARWLTSPVASNSPWNAKPRKPLDDTGRQAYTVEFLENPPKLTVRKAYVRQSLWHALLLLTLVIGVWQLAHFPNLSVTVAMTAAAACLVVPMDWLALPQSIFLGLVTAAIVHVVLRTSQTQATPKAGTAKVRAAITIVICLMALPTDCVYAQSPRDSVDELEQAGVPHRVLIPIDAQGNRQDQDVYLSESFLRELTERESRSGVGGADAVVLSASYSGNTNLNKVQSGVSNASLVSTEPWILQWKIESFVPNCRFTLPLAYGDAKWVAESHRLDGLPVQVLWEPDGNGCSVTLPEPGIHSLRLSCQPQVQITGRRAKVHLHVPPLPGATLDLASASNPTSPQIAGAVQTQTGGTEAQEFLLDGRNAINLQWNSREMSSDLPNWDRLQQLAWLKVEHSEVVLDVQLQLTGYNANSQIIDLEVSPQLGLEPLESDTFVTAVAEPSPGLLQLTLSPDTPTDFVVPLRFRLQRAGAVGQVYFPTVNVKGAVPHQRMFAVSVAAGLSYDEESPARLRTVRPAEFAQVWDRPEEEEPLFAYGLTQEDPQWSLQVWPDPQLFVAEQSLQVHCLPNRANVSFEANVDQVSNPLLSHRVSVPQSLRIEDISVEDRTDSLSVPLRWTRRSSNEVNIFLSRPLRRPHRLRIQGRMNADEIGVIELPDVALLDGKNAERHMDLYRSEESLVDWTTPAQVPRRTRQELIPYNEGKVFLGRYSWSPSANRRYSTLELNPNRQVYEAETLTSLELQSGRWKSRLHSRLVVRQGVISRLRLSVPDGVDGPFSLQPAQIGRVEEVIETSAGKEVVIRLSDSYSQGEELEIQILGSLDLAADQRLVLPSLHWIGASREERYVLLPTLAEGRSLAWRASGLRRQALPARLSEFAPTGQQAFPFYVEQPSFEAREHVYSESLLKAQIRYLHVDGLIDASGQLSATAEIVLQPGRASSCAVRLPAGSEIYQLSVGGRPARRDIRDDGSWELPVGPPFMPQRLVLSYRTKPQWEDSRLKLVPPEILLGGKTLPMPKTWWTLRTTPELALGKTIRGDYASEQMGAKDCYVEQLNALEDALSQALELPSDESRAWANAWRPVLQHAQERRQLHQASSTDDVADMPHTAFFEALGVEGESLEFAAIQDYPPSLPSNHKVSPLQPEYLLASDSRGQLEIATHQHSQLNLWPWFASLALACGGLAIAWRMRRYPNWHHRLCEKPQALALLAGITWWLLLRPSVVGFLVIVLTLASLALRQWRHVQYVRKKKPSAQLVLPTS